MPDQNTTHNKTTPTQALSDPPCSTHILTETQEYDVINALKQLANACRNQADMTGKESLGLRVKRQNAERIIKQFNL